PLPQLRRRSHFPYPAMTDPRTLNEVFTGAVARFDDADAVLFRDASGWRPLSYREVERRVAHVAAGLADLGVRAGDRVALLSENRPEWLIADYAILALGAISVPI